MRNILNILPVIIFLNSCVLNKNKTQLKEIEIQKVIWGKTDCIERINIKKHSIIRTNCNNENLKEIEFDKIKIEFLLSLDTLVLTQMTKNIIRQDKRYIPTKYSYYITTKNVNDAKEIYFISNVFDIKNPKTFEEKALFYINELIVQ
jgi:hypothetical protein